MVGVNVGYTHVRGSEYGRRGKIVQDVKGFLNTVKMETTLCKKMNTSIKVNFHVVKY